MALANSREILCTKVRIEVEGDSRCDPQRPQHVASCYLGTLDLLKQDSGPFPRACVDGISVDMEIALLG